MRDERLEGAVEVFARAISRLKSRTHPYGCVEIDGLCLLQDGPGRRGPPRKIEVITHRFEPEETFQRVQSLALGWHFLCVIHPLGAFEHTRAAYKALGYRALATEWLFVHELEAIPNFESEPPVEQVLDQVRAEQLRNQKARIYIDDDRRVYMVSTAESEPLGWVTSLNCGKANWVSDLYVNPSARNKGYGKALMSRLLRDDKSAGVRRSVLVSSTAGARVYPVLGYELIAGLQLFCPAKR